MLAGCVPYGTAVTFSGKLGELCGSDENDCEVNALYRARVSDSKRRAG